MGSYYFISMFLFYKIKRDLEMEMGSGDCCAITNVFKTTVLYT